MGDVFTETTQTGFLQNIGNAIVGVLVGIVMFVVSFPLLYINEGMINMANVAKTAAVAPADKMEPANEGKLVSVTSTLESKEQVGDPSFVKPGPWIALERKVEMFAWQEHKTEKTEKNTGGSSTTTTTYSYDTKWTTEPESDKFAHPDGHRNPHMPVGKATFKVENATVGAYAVQVKKDELTLPDGEALSLTQDLLQLNASSMQAEASGTTVAVQPQQVKCVGCGEMRPTGTGNCPACGAPASDKQTGASGAAGTPAGTPHIEGNYVFMGTGSLTSPKVGDVRVSFMALARSMKATIFGTQRGAVVEPYMIDGHRLFRAFKGTRDEAIAELAFENAMRLWILRIVGFIIMWLGMTLVLGPITAVMDVIPMLGGVGRAVIGIVTFPIALVLWAVTIVISMILHSFIAMAIVVGILVIVTFIVLRSMKKKPPTAAAPASA